MKQFDKEVEKIMNHKTMETSRKNRRIDYLVQWQDGPESNALWEQDVTLWHFEGAVKAYLQDKSTGASTLGGGGGFVTPSDA